MTAAFSEWGAQGARKYDGRVGALVVVDVLSFSTCVDIAVARGALVYPFAHSDAGAAALAAEARGAEVAGRRGSSTHRFSLSPASLTAIDISNLDLLGCSTTIRRSSSPRRKPGSGCADRLDASPRSRHTLGS